MVRRCACAVKIKDAHQIRSCNARLRTYKRHCFCPLEWDFHGIFCTTSLCVHHLFEASSPPATTFPRIRASFAVRTPPDISLEVEEHQSNCLKELASSTSLRVLNKCLSSSRKSYVRKRVLQLLIWCASFILTANAHLRTTYVHPCTSQL